jgi:hypothetical protein
MKISLDKKLFLLRAIEEECGFSGFFAFKADSRVVFW